MIEYINGKFTEVNPAYVLVETNGLGYLVQISLNTYADVNGKESGILITHYAVSVDVRSGESKHQLFGFSTQLERQLFRMLIAISGISSSIAHMVLSAFKPEEFQSLVLNGDSKTLTTVKGVGPKVAQKIVTELRDKVAKSEQFDDLSQPTGNTMRQEALSALVALGFDRGKAVKAINEIIKKENPSMVEQLIKLALKQL
jgi:Holliday junction DNA helicase RuvA